MLLDKIRSVQNTPSQPNILVIGDIMIDHYIWGVATRLSPEAPVPVVNVSRESTTLGGAGNVAQNLISLGAKVTLAGVIGEDAAGSELIAILNKENVDTCALVKDTSRPTTVKTRVLAGNHQLIRVDREQTEPLAEALEDELVSKLQSCILNADIILFSDYNKGLFQPGLTQKLLSAAQEAGKKVIVDPKGLDYAKYKGAYLIKPNRKELAEAVKSSGIKSVEDVQQAADNIIALTGAAYMVVTLSEEGIVIVSKSGHQLLPVKATQVFDVTGAGDTVLATMAYFMAAGLSVEDACELANHAAAVVIRQVGSATATLDEIIDNITMRAW